MERIIVCGAGGFGLCWVTPLRELDIDVVAVADPSADARSVFLERLGGTRPAEFADLENALLDTQADSILDCSPFFYRERHASIAFEKGLDFLGAKPLGASLESSKSIVNQARVAGCTLAVALQMREFPCFRLLRTILAERRYGRPVSATIRMALDGRGWEPGMNWRLAMANPLLLEAGIHHFDLIRWVFDPGSLRVEGAVGWNPPWSPFDGDANVDALLEAGGVNISYHARFAPHPSVVPVRFDSGWTIECESALLTVENGAVFADDDLISDPPHAEPVPLETLNTPLLQQWITRQGESAGSLASGHDYLKSMESLTTAMGFANS